MVKKYYSNVKKYYSYIYIIIVYFINFISFHLLAYTLTKTIPAYFYFS